MSRIVVGFSFVDFFDKRRRLHQETALNILASHPPLVFPVSFGFSKSSQRPKILEELKIPHLNILNKNSSNIINNNRDLPYIKEILDRCSSIDCDVFGYINSDILIPAVVYDILQLNFDAYIFSRSDIGEIDPQSFLEGKINVIHGGNQHSGADGFFFKKSWWNCNRNRFPDNLIMGSPEWDTVYRTVIKKSPCRYLEARALFHVYHTQTWAETSPSALNNIAIWEEIKKTYRIK